GRGGGGGGAGGAAAAGGPAWGQDRDGDAAPAARGPVAGLSHQRWSAGTVGRTGAAAGCSSVASRLRWPAQSGSQHSCSFRASSSTCGSPSAASCFQASVLNGG